MSVDITGITVEQAQAVLSARSKVVQAEREAEGRKLLWRFFKHREHVYDPMEAPSTWWKYAQITAVTDWGSPHGWTFQRKPDSIEVRPNDRLDIWPGSLNESQYGWLEITESEFWGAAMGIREELTARLTERSRRD